MKKQHPNFSLSGLSLITFLLLGLMNLPLRHAAKVGETGDGMTRFLWIVIDLIRLLQLVALGVLVFTVIRGIARFFVRKKT